MTAPPALPPFTMADPAASTPPRRPGSIRRTTTHECQRHEGLSGPVTVEARGRDLLTDPAARAVVLDASSLTVVGDFTTGILEAVDGEPPDPGLDGLVGSSVYAKFRNAVEHALPGLASSSSVRFQLLDDLPTVLMLSGRVPRVAGVELRMSTDRRPPITDLCAGWAEGGSAITFSTDGRAPMQVGPTAPTLDGADDDAWHDVGLLPPDSTRRRRRLDVWEEAGRAHVDCFFRDSHADGDGLETVVHEWHVTAALDAHTLEFETCGAEMGPLPFVECPGARSSALRLVGTTPEGLRRSVRKTFVGPSTCTHLNDTLRSFEDLGALLTTLRSSQPASAQG
jgi:hypothetical protein